VGGGGGREVGYGGVSVVARATGLARSTIHAGLRDVRAKIEHRLFSFISQNWRGKPLVSHQAIVNLIAATTTRTGLRVKAALDTRRYETALQVPDEVFARLRITPHTFHGEWNYTIAPRH
jgi:Rhodopirellula transposase DDE domain